MKFTQNMSVIFDNKRKTKLVIESCNDYTQLDNAANYVENFRKWLSHISCNDNVQRDLLKEIIDEVELCLRTRMKLLS
jgi:hypothetical protein